MTRTTPSAGDSDTYELAVSTSHLLHVAQQLAADRFTALVGPDGITLRQFTVLASIAKSPGLSQAELVRITSIDRSTLADMMPRMERRGLILRSASDKDGRANAVHLTVEGKAALASAREFARAADARILDAFGKSKRKRKSFLDLLKELAAYSEEEEARALEEARRAARKKERAEAKADRKRRRKGKSKRRSRLAAPEPELEETVALAPMRRKPPRGKS